MSRSNQDFKVDLTEEAVDFQELEDELANLDLKNAFVIDCDSNKPNAITEPQTLKVEDFKQPFFSVLPATNEVLINDIPQVVEVIECDESINYISEKLSITPSGIIECQVPHIGTTFLELHADRNSIILFPREDEAKLYAKEYPEISFYVDIEEMMLEQEVTVYRSDNNKQKFLVTPSSVSRLLDCLGQEEALKYFFMIKDMEKLQSECNYKPYISTILDYYMAYPKDKRCICTTDYKAFSHPVLKSEDIHIIKWHHLPKRNIKVRPCSNTIGVLKETIEKLPDTDKVLIVYTSVSQARLSILNLKEDIQKECCILCSTYNKEDTGEFYASIDELSEILSKRITFLALNKFDIKVNDKCHLITVSDTSRGSTTMSLKDITSVYDLCKPDNILSDTGIHNTIKCYDKWNDDIALLIERADKISKLQNTADELSRGDSSLQRLFSIVKSTIKNKASGRIRGRFPNIKLTRIDAWNRCAVAYMNIDSLLLRTNLYKSYYYKPECLGTALNKLYPTITSDKLNNDQVSKEQKEREKEEKTLYQDKVAKGRLAVLDNILRLHTEGKLNMPYLEMNSRRGTRASRKIYEEVKILYPYISTEELIAGLKAIKSGNKIGFKTFNNSVIYWALDDEHPLKLSLNKAFKIGEKYSNTEIRERMNPIIQYHLHKDWTGNERKTIALFKCFFKTIRPKREYIIQAGDKFNIHKERISKEENNLLKILIITDSQPNKSSASIVI